MKKVYPLLLVLLIPALLAAQQIRSTIERIKITPSDTVGMKAGAFKPAFFYLHLEFNKMPERDTAIDLELEAMSNSVAVDLPRTHLVITKEEIARRGPSFPLQININYWLKSALSEDELVYVHLKGKPDPFTTIRFRWVNSPNPPDSPEKAETPKVAPKPPDKTALTFALNTLEIQPVYTSVSNEKKIYTEKIPIKRKLNDALTEDTIEFDLPDNAISNVSILPATQPFILPAHGKSDKTDKDTMITDTALVDLVVMPQEDHLKYDQPTPLVIKDRKVKGEVNVVLTERGLVNPNIPFWLEVGANFDLLDHISANNLYSGVYIYKKDINKSRYALFGGVYESRTSSLSNTSDSGLIYRDGRSYKNDGQGFPYFRDTGSVSISSSVTSIGLFFSPLYRLGKAPAETNGIHLFVGAWIEMVWQKVKVNYDYAGLNNDTTYHVATTASIYKYPFKEKVTNVDYRSHYFGVSLPLYFKEDNYDLYINPVFGFTNQRFAATEDKYERNDSLRMVNRAQTVKEGQLPFAPGGVNLPNRWNPFYIVQFRLNEEKLGISFTGEVRGLIIKDKKPFISLALSKKIDLPKFFSTILAPVLP